MTDQNKPTENPQWKKRFFTIWIGQAFSMVGSSLVGFAFVWFLTEKTGSATILAVGSMMSMLPSIIIGPLAGALVDRWSRKAVLIISDSITALFTFLLAFLFITDSAQVWHIFLVMFIRSSSGQFQWAAMIASTSLMVPKKQLSRVAGANQTLNGLINIIGPTLGAFFVAVMPLQGILFIDVFTAVLAVGPLLFFKIPQPTRSPTDSDTQEKTKTSVWQDLVEGWRYVKGWPALMGIIFLAMIVNFLVNPIFSLMPLMVTDYFGKGAYELGLIDSVFGIGAIVGGLILSAWGGFKNMMLTSLSALAISGGAILLVGLAPSNGYVLALIGIAIFGIMNPIINGPLFATVQAKVSPELQGRVFSLLSAGAALTSPLGLAIAGPLTDATHNTQIWTIAAGVLTALVSLLTFTNQSIREMGEETEKTDIEPG